MAKKPLKEMLPKEFYEAYKASRTDYEDRAELFAKVTLPYIFQDEANSGSDAYADSQTQSFGGRCVNTLTSKMGMALMPPSSTFFRLEPPPLVMNEVSQGDENVTAGMYQALGAGGTMLNHGIEQKNIRHDLFYMLRHLIIVGCVIMEKLEGEGIFVHTLRDFTVKLNAKGKCRAFCVTEKIDYVPEGATVDNPDDGEWELFTYCYYDVVDKKWVMKQQIGDDTFGDEKTYSDEDLPFEYIGWNWSRGDTYHRPYVEDYYADFTQFEKLTNVLTDGAVIASKTLLFVDERRGRTRIKSIVDAPNGEVLNGSADDVSSLTLDKNFDFQKPEKRESMLRAELSLAFLLAGSSVRDSERTTAYEISLLAKELETSNVSGIYTVLSHKFSKTIVEWEMDEQNMKFESFEVAILTGLDALGRSTEAQKQSELLQTLMAFGYNDYVNEGEAVNRFTSYSGINPNNLINTPAQVKDLRATRAKAQAQATAQTSVAEQAGSMTEGAVMKDAEQAQTTTEEGTE